MNKQGFTLVEVIVAGALFLLAASCFNFISKTAMRYVQKTEAKARSLYAARSEMERLRSLPFESLSASVGSGETKLTPLDTDLCLIKVGLLYTLRSRY